MLKLILGLLETRRERKQRERNRRRVASLRARPCLETMEERIVPATIEFGWKGGAAAWTAGYAHLGMVGSSWENPANWVDIATGFAATTLPQNSNYVDFGTIDTCPCILNANEDIGNMDFFTLNAGTHIPKLIILAGKKLEIHNDLATEVDVLGHNHETFLGADANATIQINAGLTVHTGGQLEFHGGNTVWNAVTVSVDNSSWFKGDIFLDGSGFLHVGKASAHDGATNISDSAHIWISFTPTLTNGNYTPDNAQDWMYVDTFDNNKNFELANNADIYNGRDGKIWLDANTSNNDAAIIDLTTNSQIYNDGVMERTNPNGDFNYQNLNVNVANTWVIEIDDSSYLKIVGSGVGSYSLTNTGSISIGSTISPETGGSHLNVGNAVHQGYHQTAGSLLYGEGTQFFEGTGLIEGGKVEGYGVLSGGASGTGWGSLFLTSGNWVIKGSTELDFGIDGSMAGQFINNDSITIAVNFTLTIGDDATHNNVVIDTFVYNQAPTRNNQYTLLKSGGNPSVTILDSTALTILVDANSPFSATWSDVNSTWGTNLVLTEQ
jgi:hypothetical protein